MNSLTPVSYTHLILANSTTTKAFNDNFDQIAPILFMYVRDGPYSTKVTEAFKKLYLNNQPISNATRDGLGEVYIYFCK